MRDIKGNSDQPKHRLQKHAAGEDQIRIPSITAHNERNLTPSTGNSICPNPNPNDSTRANESPVPEYGRSARRLYRLTKEEIETIYRMSAADRELDFVSADPKMIRYVQQQGYEPKPDDQLSGLFSCKIPVRKLRIGKREVKLSARQRAALAHGVKFGEANPRSNADKSKNVDIDPPSDIKEGKDAQNSINALKTEVGGYSNTNLDAYKGNGD